MTDNDIQPDFGEQEDIRECSVSLRIGSEDLDATEISSVLGLVATRSFRKGEEYVSRTGRVMTYPIGMWHFSTKSNKSKSLEQHCRQLLLALDDRTDALKNLRESGRYRISLTVRWDSGGAGHGGFEVSGEAISRLAMLVDDVEVHFM
jgi:Domain of unknown function (DUF4279)